MRLLYLIQVLFIIGYTVVCANHLPEDKKDDGVELIREKRDNFIDRILKSIPFLHMSAPQNVLEEEQIDQLDEEDDDDDDDDDDQIMTSTTIHPSVHPSTTVGLSSLPSHVASGAASTSRATPAVLSTTVPHPPTPYSTHSTVSVSMSKDSIITSSSSANLASSMIKTTPAQSSTIMMTASITDSDAPSADSFMNTPVATTQNSVLNSSLYTYPLSSSAVSTMHASVLMPSSVSKMAATPLAGKEDSEPVIKMMIMSGESPMRVQDYAGRIADERGYGNDIAKEQVGEEMDVKNMRFMYASVLVPVMSGLVGALLITFGILIFKCMKRKKLKRVRYYGNKPGSGLYRLDQIGLLSDMSSDEE